MTRSKGCLVLFIISVIAGTIAGYFLIKTMITSPPPDETPTSVEPQPPSDRSVLVIGVDNLEKPNPALEGAWRISLIENADGVIHIEIITLYPVIDSTVSSTLQIPYIQQHSAIHIDPNNLQSVSDLEPISFTHDNWSQVIALDETAINTIIMMQNLNFVHPVPTPVPGVFKKPWEEPQETFEQHERILTLLCSNPTPISDPNNIDILIDMEGNHILSTLPEGGLRSLWQVINYSPNKQVICSHIP